jgi:uncharacterized protein YndB with AHSA1/START domain
VVYRLRRKQNKKERMTQLKKPNELFIQRLYDAPVPLVWSAWTDPQQAALWWGPRGFTITNKSKDFKTGGSWVYTVHGPDGVDYPNHTLFLEVEHHARMVYDHGGNKDQPPMFRVTAVFTAVGQKTQVDMIMAFDSEQTAIRTEGFIKQVGGDSTWDRLAEYLAKQQHGKQIFVINRSVAVSIEQMYQLWTDAARFAQWLAPSGSLQFIRADIRPGGSTFSVMKHNEQSPPMFGRSHFLELDKPNRIVYTQQFCDEHENVTRHPMAATWPETKLTTITLAAEAAFQTRVTIQWEPFGKVNQQEIDTFADARAGMATGWAGSLDGLEAYAKIAFA